MVLHYSYDSTSDEDFLNDYQIKEIIDQVLRDNFSDRSKVAIIPPDFTRYHSKAGLITQCCYTYYKDKIDLILPALGTHDPVSSHQKSKMFSCFLPPVPPVNGPVDNANANANANANVSQTTNGGGITSSTLTSTSNSTNMITSISDPFKSGNDEDENNGEGNLLMEIPDSLFRVHNWREDVVTVGTVPKEFVHTASRGFLNEEWPCQLNKMIWEGNHDLILSIGQVVPHEVMGMANYNKNLYVGIGGKEAINLSHFIGAVYGMESMMGIADNPLRRILDYASENLTNHMPIVYVLTVIGSKIGSNELVCRGLYIGDDKECFLQAAKRSANVNFTLLEEPVQKVVAYLDEEEFLSTWLGNKAIYRSRMTIADGGELIILAPGVRKFGEDGHIDSLIRKYGYRTTPELMDYLKQAKELQSSLATVAHLIHGSSEGRFKVTYCTRPENLSKEDIENVGYSWKNYEEMSAMYDPKELEKGMNTVGNEEIFYIPAPAQGLWACRAKFENR